MKKIKRFCLHTAWWCGYRCMFIRFAVLYVLDVLAIFGIAFFVGRWAPGFTTVAIYLALRMAYLVMVLPGWRSGWTRHGLSISTQYFNERLEKYKPQFADFSSANMEDESDALATTEEE